MTSTGSLERRLLMIARHFPPTNVSGALRLASFARHLPAAGWTTTVITARGGNDPDVNEDGIVPGCTVLRTNAPDAKSLFAVRGRYPALLAFPDRSAPWIVGGIRCALRYCQRQRVDAILSTSPDVSAHYIGYATAIRTGLPWIIDLRDPWNCQAPFGPLLRRLDKRVERALLRRAAAITVTTPGMVAQVARTHGEAIGRKLHLIHNGYENESLQDALNQARLPAHFTLVQIGNALPYRDTSRILHAVRLCLDRGTLPGDLSVDLIGADGDEGLIEAAARLDLRSVVRVTPRVSHRAALAELGRASVLLLLQPHPAFDLAIPAKAYEYLASGRMILAVTQENSETASLLRGFDGVWMAPPGDVELIATALEAMHTAWKTSPGRVFQRDVRSYTRQQQALRLGRVLDAVVTTEKDTIVA